jgi:hypothetical protein
VVKAVVAKVVAKTARVVAREVVKAVVAKVVAKAARVVARGRAVVVKAVVAKAETVYWVGGCTLC